MSATAIISTPEAELMQPGFDAAALTDLMGEIAQVPAEHRHEALVDWARSPLWAASLVLLEGWQGEVSRAAWRALKRDLDADTPGRRWDACDHALGRLSIHRLLGMEGNEAATYACLPFRTWIDDDARSWIAGAIGIRPIYDLDAALRWQHLDIRDVILWDPRTNEARLAGEHSSYSGYVMPERQHGSLKVWGDPGAFFRAWAEVRARRARLLRAAVTGAWKHPASELPEDGMPGGLLIGNAARARWPGTDVATVTAGPGVTAAELHISAIRAANLPNFEGWASGRGN